MAAEKCHQLQANNPDEPKCGAVVKKDPFVGNVSKVAPLPKGHSGPVQKGQLVFDACFESGESQAAQTRPTHG